MILEEMGIRTSFHEERRNNIAENDTRVKDSLQAHHPHGDCAVILALTLSLGMAVLVALLSLLLCTPDSVRGVEPSGGGSPVPFVSIGQGSVSGIVDPQEVVIQSAEEWRELWSTHAPSAPAPPPVDFARELVVGIFAGQRPTSGYQVQVVRVERGETMISVVYQVTGPPADAMVAQVLTQPFLLITLPRLGLPIRFSRP
jgi:hypothetical protein